MDIRKYFSFKKFENILFCIFNLTIGRGRQRVPMGTGVPAGIQQNFKILGTTWYQLEAIYELGYRWEPRTEKILDLGYCIPEKVR